MKKKILLLAGAGLLTLSAVTASVLHQNSTKKPVKKQNTCSMKEKSECSRAHSSCPFSN